MKKHIFLCLLISSYIFASIVPIDRAKKVAENYYQFYAPSEVKGSVIEKVLTKEYLGQPTWYVVKFTKGWVIVAAEDNVRPILGYSFDSEITEDLYNMRNPFVHKFSSYDKQIVHDIREKGIVRLSQQKEWKNAESSVFPNWSKAAVGPLVLTKWHQDFPFNGGCPTGTPVGCVATAMTQVMRYWQTPSCWAGTHSYTDNLGSTTGSHSVTSGTFEWSLLQGIYGSDFDTVQEKDEISEFCYDAAVSINTDFETNGSGAYLSDAVQALKDHFAYDSQAVWNSWGTVTDSSAYYSTIKAQIDSGRPMILAGYGESGGHAYVLSGYNVTVGSSYFYHFNWGWGGSYDGWFQINDLTPGSADFTESQQAGYNIFGGYNPTPYYPAVFTTSCATENDDIFLQWDWSCDDPDYSLSYVKLLRNNKLISTFPSSTRNYTDRDLIDGSYTYQIISYFGTFGAPDAYSSSHWSLSFYTAEILPVPNCSPPLNLKASVQHFVRSKIDVSWSKPFIGVTYAYDGFEGNTGNEYTTVPVGWTGKTNEGDDWPPSSWSAQVGSAGWIALGTGYSPDYSLEGDWSVAALGSGSNYKMMFFSTPVSLSGAEGTFIEWWAYTEGDNGNLKALLYKGTSIPETLIPADLYTIGSETYQADDQYTHKSKFPVPADHTGSCFVGICYDAVNTDAYIVIDEFRFGYDTWPSGNQPVSYDIYRNGSFAANYSATGLSETFEDMGFSDGLNEYYIKAVYATGTSLSTQRAQAYIDKYPAPHYLTGGYNDTNGKIYLSWFSPAHCPPHWFAWHYDTDNWTFLTYELEAGNVTKARTYFNAYDFDMGYPVHITKISASFYEDPSICIWATDKFRLAVGTGKDNSVTYLHTSGELTALKDGTPIDYELPVQLDITEDWFVEVQYISDFNTMTPNLMTFVHEEGIGKGWNSLWYWDGAGTNEAGWYAYTYDSPYEYEDFQLYCYGWNDETSWTKSSGSDIANSRPSAKGIKKKFDYSTRLSRIDPVIKSGATLYKDNNSRGLVSYNIYRNGSFIAGTQNEYFADTTFPDQDNTYYITTAWTDPAGESEPSNQIETGPPVHVSLPANITHFAVPASLTQNSFKIGNTGRGALDYSLSFDYITPMSEWITPIKENCSSLTDDPVWSASGSGGTPWSVYTEYTLDGSPCFRSAGVTTNTVTQRTIISPVFDGTYVDSLEYDQYFLKNGATPASGTVYVSTDGGTNWTNLYTVSATTGGWDTGRNHKKIAISNISANMKLKFELNCSARNNSSWAIDNITMGGVRVNFGPWFSFVSPIEGEISGNSGSDIICRYDASVVSPGIYHANINVLSDDPDHPVISVPVTYNVTHLPGTPVLSFPEDGSRFSELDLQFDWADASAANTYSIQIDDQNDFTSPAITASGLTSSIFSPYETLPFGTYYWRVKAFNSYGESAYSQVWSFLYSPAIIPGVPDVSVSLTETGGVMIAWKACLNATCYDIYACTEPYGEFSFIYTTSALKYIYTGKENRMFFYVVARNATKEPLKTIKIKMQNKN